MDQIPQDPNLKLAIAQDLIDKIVENTKAGKRADGKPLKKPYSDSYADSLRFKAFGKDKNKVNMQLTGSMLESIEVKDVSGDQIIIGFNDTTDSEKAHGHVTGNIYDNKFDRNFFGLPDYQVRDIVEGFKDQVQQQAEPSEIELFFSELIARRRQNNPFGGENPFDES